MNHQDNSDLEEEVRELLKNYKLKKPTAYEPCNLSNYKECLIGLGEEFGLYNINYIFNPHIDIEDNTLTTEALVKLINSVWTLLHYHKDVNEKSDRLLEQNHCLERNNKLLNNTINQLKEKVGIEKNEARACVASVRRLSDQSDEMYNNLIETRAKLAQLKKQKETNEKSFKHEIARLKLENLKLTDKVRGKSGTYTPCSDVCDSTLLQLREKDRKQKAVIAQLQSNNQELLREVLAMKEELILQGFTDFKISKRNK